MVAVEAASLAFSAAAAVAFSSPAGLGGVEAVGAVADFGAAGVPAFGAPALGCGVAGFGFAVVGFFAGAGLEAVPASGFGAADGADAEVGADVVPAFGAGVDAFGFGFGFGFDAVPAFGLDAVPADDGVEAFVLDAVPALGFGAVADFGAPEVPALGVAFGLRAVVPAARVRAVRVVVGAEAPVLVPPARGAGAGVSTVVSGSSS